MDDLETAANHGIFRVDPHLTYDDISVENMNQLIVNGYIVEQKPFVHKFSGSWNTKNVEFIVSWKPSEEDCERLTKYTEN